MKDSVKDSRRFLRLLNELREGAGQTRKAILVDRSTISEFEGNREGAECISRHNIAVFDSASIGLKSHKNMKMRGSHQLPKAAMMTAQPSGSA